MKKIVIGLCCLLCLAQFIPVVEAKDAVTVYIFTKGEDEISQKTVLFFKKLQNKYTFEVVEYEVWNSEWKEDREKRKLADKVAETFGEEIIGAPYIVIGDNYTLDEYAESFNEELENALINELNNNKYVDVVEKIYNEIKKQNSVDKILAPLLMFLLPSIIGTIIFISRKSQKNKD